MSNHYDIKCVTCDERLYPTGWWTNGAGAKFTELISHRDALAAAAPGLEELEASGVVNDFQYSTLAACRFFAAHAGHDIRTIDEYGTLWGQCGRRVFCGCCGSGSGCKLPSGHDGPCAGASTKNPAQLPRRGVL